MRLSNKALRNHLAELREGQGNEIANVVSHLGDHDYVCCESTVELIKHIETLARELLAARKVVAAAKAYRREWPTELTKEGAALDDALDAYEKRVKGKASP